MEPFDFTAPAEVYANKGGRRKAASVHYRRFDRGADAVQYAVEVLGPDQLRGAAIETGDGRFESAVIRELYDSDEYPYPRAAPGPDLPSSSGR